MPQNKYRIYELSARSVMSYATQESGQWHFALDRAATEKCRSFSALHEQDGNALFFQIMPQKSPNIQRKFKCRNLWKILLIFIFF